MTNKKVRVYDLAKELRIDTKKAIEEIRREGVDVSVASNSVDNDIADRVRARFLPKKAATPAAPRLVKVVKAAPAPTEVPTKPGEAEEPKMPPSAVATEPEVAEEVKPAQPRVRVLKASPTRQAEARAAQDARVEETKVVSEKFDPSVASIDVEELERVFVESEAEEEEEGGETTPSEPVADRLGTLKIRKLGPVNRTSVPPHAPVEEPAPRPVGPTVRVLTRKPGAEHIPSPRAQARPGFEQPAVDGGPAKLPPNTTYIPPKDKVRPRGLRGSRKGKTFKDSLAPKDRAMNDGGRQQVLGRAAAAAAPARKVEFTELRPMRLVEGTTLKDFAEKLEIKPKDVVTALLSKGVMATINQTLNQEVAVEIAKEFGYDVTYVQFEEMVADADVESAEATGAPAPLEERAPVVTVMGHVDHGKTSLLDAIRSARVAEGEAGGITQHISAFSVQIADPDEKTRQRRIVFIDTPGHEAFTTMRARGAKVTDVVVLVVAADDGVMPQTVEAIDHARAADVPIIVAINKIDKPEANPDRVRQELTEHGLLWDAWGGETVMVEISAKKKMNIDALLEMIVLTADLRELKAAQDRLASGVVLDAFLDKGRGAVATVLVQNGTLKVGDPFIVGPVFGRVRALFDDRGVQVDAVGPSTPVQVLGANGVPHAGDVFQAVDDVAKAQHISSFRQSKQRMERIAADSRRGLDSLFADMQQGQIKELQIILKADVQGSVEAVKDTLLKLSSDKVKIRVVRAGVGAITESDVMLASAANKDMNRSAVIVGFNVRPEPRAEEIAKSEGVDVRLHTIIYKVQEEIRDAMVGMLDKAKREVALGRAEIREVIRVPKVGNVCGCMVVDGGLKRSAEIRLIRDNVVIHTGRVESLRRFKEDVAEVKQGFECGVVLERFQDIRVGDIIEAYRTEEVAQTEL